MECDPVGVTAVSATGEGGSCAETPALRMAESKAPGVLLAGALDNRPPRMTSQVRPAVAATATITTRTAATQQPVRRPPREPGPGAEAGAVVGGVGGGVTGGAAGADVVTGILFC